MASSGQQSPSGAHIEYSCKIEEILTLFVAPAGKYGNCQGQPFPSASLVGLTKVGHPEIPSQRLIKLACELPNRHGEKFCST
jgi:hypothetical protein